MQDEQEAKGREAGDFLGTGLDELDEVGRISSPPDAIEEIECLVPDQGGVARGKIMPVSKFLNIAGDEPAAVDLLPDASPANIPTYEGLVDVVEADTDMFMQPDWST